MKLYPKLPISDPLHLLKAMRKLYFTYTIMMTSQSTPIKHINEIDILMLSSSYHQEIELSSSLSSMKDDISLILINTENLVLLAENHHFSFFIFQFILVLMITVNQSKYLTSEARIELCKIGFYSLMKINNNSIDFQRKKVNSEFIARHFDSNTFNRISNNFLCFAFAFGYYDKNLKTSSLSSHRLELSFGRIREGSHRQDTSEIAVNVISKGKITDNTPFDCKILFNEMMHFQ